MASPKANPGVGDARAQGIHTSSSSEYPNSQNVVSAQERPTFLLTLRPEPHVTDTPRALKRALKALLRQHGLRCVSIVEASQ